VLFDWIVLADEPPSSSLDGRVGNGQEANGGMPGGNIAVQFRTASGWCTGSVVNSDWIVTAGHCIDNALPAETIRIRYTPSNGETKTIRTTSIAEIYLDPDFKSWNNSFGWITWFFDVWGFSPNDFGMIRLSDPLLETCQEDDAAACNGDIPMNPYIVYEMNWPGLFARGFFDRGHFHIFGYGTTDDEINLGTYRTGQIRKIFSLNGSILVAWFRNRIFGKDDARGCSGDSGAPWLVDNSHDGDGDRTFAIAGVFSQRTSCQFLAGFMYAKRILPKNADAIEANVESSGGFCERSIFGNDKVLRCFNGTR